jgi:adenylate kinase
MVALEVNEEELEKRLLIRGKDSGRPDDQNPAIIKKRVQEYTTKTAQVANFYKAQNKFYAVGGIGSISEIFESIVNVVTQL